MHFNTCCTARSFDSPRWMEAYREFHRDLRLPDFSDPGRPVPSMFHWYREGLWRERPEETGRVWCGRENVGALHKIWEYVQVLAAVRQLLPRLEGRRILSLGAGVESPLWTLARWGAEVTATDIYAHRRYWHPEHRPHLRTDPSVYCPYREAFPVRFRDLDLRRRGVAAWWVWRGVKPADAIFSISSLEHVHGVGRRAAVSFHAGILRRKLALFRRIARRIAPGGVLAFTTELITRSSGLRRLDFFSREELAEVVEALQSEGLEPVDGMDWDTLEEQHRPTRDVPGQYHTAVCLVLRKPAPA